MNILDEEKKKELASSILKEINGNDSTQKKDIEELHEEIKNLQIRHEKEGKNTFSFNLSHLPEFFIKREVILNELKKELSSKDQEVKMSRMVLINGKYGTGKSELAKSYAYSREGDSISSTWKNVVWINAETCDTLLNSFRNLAKELKIPKKKYIDHNVVRGREIESIVKDVYENFRDVKSLFIFDNANNSEEIEKFLPSHFLDLFFHREKPYVLITSRNKNWKEEIEKIDLDNGFSLGEAITFIERTLGIDEKDRSQDGCLVELAKALCYLPLALAQATAYIKQEKINISEYLKRYNEAMQESNPDYLEAQGISKELFTTLKVNFDEIRGEKNIGQPACNILYCMAYLDPNQIDIEEIFLQKKSGKDKQQTLDALDRLHKFSVIELKESIAKIHMGVQKTIRVKKEQEETEEETLRNIMTSFCLTHANHAISVWSHASKYDRLVNDFIDSIYDGSTILHLLAKDGNEEVIKLILEKIDPNKFSKVINAVDEQNLTALDYAVIHGHSYIIKYLVEKGGSMQSKGAMHWAANNGDLETVKYLVEQGADVNLQDEGGMSPMHWAANGGNLETVKYLVEQGANVNLQDEGGMSPMHWAANGGDLRIIKYLVEQGADVNLQDEGGMSPMHWAANSGNLKIVQYLVRKKADIDLQNKAGMSLMHWAVNSGNLKIVQYLVRKKADIDPQNKVGTSPMHWAADSGDLKIVKYLVKKGANVDLQDESGISLMHYAIANDRLEIIEYLLEQGAKLCQESKDYLYHYAAVNGYLCIIHYLEAQFSASDLKIQSHKRHLKTSVYLNESKKRKLENVSAISEENASNTQLLQGSHNLPLDTSILSLDLLNRMEMESVVNFTHMPMSLFNSVAVERVNNKNLRR